MKKNFFLTGFAVLVVLLNSCNQPAATCTDGIHNQNETNIDCGGSCPTCPTCSDGIQNQGETGIDCGGPCSVCQTCSDGIQNQGETGIDCGGPCAICPIIYPASGVFGPSFLRQDTITLKGVPGPVAQPAYNYSMRADLPDNSTLRVKMINQSTGIWSFFLGSQTGWSIGAYQPQGNYQEFTASGKVNCDVHIYFKGSGAATLEFYEYGATTPTRTKQITWSL